MKKYIFLIIIVILFFILIYSCKRTKEEIITVAGALRFKDSLWILVEDTNHTYINCKEVKTNNGYATIIYDFTASKVITFIITSDEEYAKAGINFGVSAGLNQTRIYYYDKNGEIATNLNIPYSNIWFEGLFLVYIE